MSNSYSRVIRTARLLPETVKIGILESEIKNELKAEPPKSDSDSDIKSRELDKKSRNKKLQVEIPKPDRELLAQIKKLQSSLTDSEVRNIELREAKEKLESEIDGVKSDYAQRKREIEANAAANAKKAADEARSKGHDEGYNKGYNEGLVKARAEIEKEYLDKFSQLAGVIEGLGKNLEANFADLVKLNQPRMIRMWSEMLRRMLQRQVELNPDTIDKVLTELISRLSDKNNIVIYVSPEDIKRLEGDIDAKFREALRGVKRLELKSDPNVDDGSCIVETRLGVYDARWRTQLAQVESVVDNIFQEISKESQESQAQENQSVESVNSVNNVSDQENADE